jgi:hypothetical protein
MDEENRLVPTQDGRRPAEGARLRSLAAGDGRLLAKDPSGRRGVRAIAEENRSASESQQSMKVR